MDSSHEIVDFSSRDGRINVKGFCVSARAFADKWRRHNQSLPPWSWVPLINRTLLASNKVKHPMKQYNILPKIKTCLFLLCYKQEEGYLSLDKVLILSSLEEIPEEESIDVSEDSLETGQESIDHTILVKKGEKEAHYYDFHIVYSASYGVPVLYFRGCCSGGEALSLDVIKKDLPSCSVSLMLESKWTFITHEEHPYLNRPWFKLHPCGTEEWVKLLSQNSISGGCLMPLDLYLVSWFSVVGQVVGLKIPLEMLN
ncbi:unnamed protein product [Cochlearia groenlandica]